MRPLLATLPSLDHSDASSASDYSFSSSEPPYLPLQASDWDALEAICAKLDEPGGPQTFNSLDYTHACRTLQIGPSSLWFAAYQIIAAFKLGKPLTWAAALRDVRRRQMRLQRLESSRQRYCKCVLAAYFRKWRHMSSEENVLMAKCYAFEVNTVLAPVFELWRVSAQALQIYDEDMSVNVRTLQLRSILRNMAAATAKIPEYETQSVALEHSFNPGLSAMSECLKRLETQLEISLSKTKNLWFRKWKAKTAYTCQDGYKRKAQLSRTFAALKQRAQEQAQNNIIATDLDRYNTLAPCIVKLWKYSQQLATAQYRARDRSINQAFTMWNEITHLQLETDKFRTRTRTRVAGQAFQIWRQNAPLQAKSMRMYAESTAGRVLHAWKLHLKCTLLRDSWHYHQVQQIINYWYLKCSAEVRIQYNQLETRHDIFELWRSKEQVRNDANASVLAKVYYPHWASNAVDRMRSRIEIMKIDAARAQMLQEKFTKARGFRALSMAIDRADEMDQLAGRIYVQNTQKNIISKWTTSYQVRRDTILEEKAADLHMKQQCDLKRIYIGDWRQMVKKLELWEKKAGGLLKRRYLSLWNSQVALFDRRLAAAAKLSEKRTKKLVFTMGTAVQDQIQVLEAESRVFDEIRAVQLQQTFVRRMQMRVVRYHALETEAKRFADRKKYDSVKFVLRHWYSKAISPHIEPMTPRSARRLPPSALRKIVLESKQRPSSTPGPGADTPTRANRRLFRPYTS